MKCEECGGTLVEDMPLCLRCGSRRDGELRKIGFRDLGVDESLPCPSCAAALSVIELETVPALRIERCHGCHGMFFNPGELEAILDIPTNPLVPAPSVETSGDSGQRDEIFYKKCPMCSERMSHLNFGGRSGVILDRCGAHGAWVESDELCRLTEWWRSGGGAIYQQQGIDSARRFHNTQAAGRASTARRISPPETWSPTDVLPWIRQF